MKVRGLKTAFICILLYCFCYCSDAKKEQETPVNLTSNSNFIKGMDLSFQPEMESFNVVYKDENNNAINLLPFVKQKGCNLIRLKIWVNPINGLNGLPQVKAYALKIKQNNLQFLLDFHYSDTWADPANQTPPIAWQNYTINELKNQVYNYTKQVMTELLAQGTPPNFVQIGNETDSGFLWNYGKVWNQFASNFGTYAALFNKGSQAIREVSGNNTKIIFHHSSVENCNYFLTELINNPIDYDVIGLSYYPQFQSKDLNLIQSKLNYLASNYNKEIMLVEIAYPFTLNFNDGLSNYIGNSNQIISDYPATPQGQKDYLLKMISIIKAIPNNKGIGFIYWAPDWVSFSGNQQSSLGGSSWENQCLWDFDNKALPALTIFQQ